MALRITRNVGTATVFHVRDRTAKLSLLAVEDLRAVFGLSDNHKLMRIRSTAGRSLKFQVRGELIDAYIEEVNGYSVVLRITASPDVQIRREELTTTPAPP